MLLVVVPLVGLVVGLVVGLEPEPPLVLVVVVQPVVLKYY